MGELGNAEYTLTIQQVPRGRSQEGCPMAEEVAIDQA